MKRQPLIAACAFICAACLMPLAPAAELVTLSNGFQMRCDHHVAANGSFRIYLTAGNDNYIELPPSEIASVSQILIPMTAPESSPAAEKVGLQKDTGVSRKDTGSSEKGTGGKGTGFSPYITEPKSTRALAPDGSLSPNSPHALPAASTAQPALTAADLRQMLDQAGRTHNLDVDLLASVVHAESGGNPRAVSPAGARGLMQLMPVTAATLGVQNSFQPQQNVGGGSAYLDALLTHYSGNLALALAAYNAGPEAVDRYHGIPPYPETRAYVARVIHEFNRRVLARRDLARRAAATQPLPHKLHAAIAQK